MWIGAAWYAIFGVDKSPEILQFKVFQVEWPTLDKSKYHGLTPDKRLQTKRNQVVAFLKDVLQREKLPRDDYKECVELVLVVLGEIPPGFSFKKPGANHKARQGFSFEHDFTLLHSNVTKCRFFI